jgi:hypothetical protein
MYYNDTHTARADQADPIDMTDTDQSTSSYTSADTCVKMGSLHLRISTRRMN